MAQVTGDSAGTLSLMQLEDRLTLIESELEVIAPLSMRSGVGATGFRSVSYSDSRHPVWIQLNFDESHLIDQVVLVPTIWRDQVSGFRADSFPEEFEIRVGGPDDTDGQVVARFSAEDKLLPRVAPVIIPLARPRHATWVRLNVASLTKRTWDGRYDLQLSEFMVFSGQANVALHQRVEVSADAYQDVRSLDKRFLVDGHVPYLMAARHGERSQAYLGRYSVSDRAEFTIDLGDTQSINQIHLHTIDVGDIVPQSENSDFAVPRRFAIEGANRDDFSDSSELTDFHLKSVYDTGPIIKRRFPPVSCRYVRLIAVEPYVDQINNGDAAVIGFAEIELYCSGKNVAVDRPFSTNLQDHLTNGRRLSALTDDRNFYGDLVPERTWVEQMAKRHDLETELVIVRAELDDRYVQQTINLRRTQWLAAGATACTIFLLMVSQIIRTRQLSRLKERFAADMHDELGANLHAIGLLSDLADATKEDHSELSKYLQQIRGLSERTGIAATNCADLLHTGELQAGFAAEMERAAQRIVVGMEHELSIQGDQYLHQLGPRTRMDLFLFFKETLVNSCRHSKATKLTTRLDCCRKQVHLVVSDDGQGLTVDNKLVTPPSLRRRARMLGGNVAVSCPESGGTRVDLRLTILKWGLFRRS